MVAHNMNVLKATELCTFKNGYDGTYYVVCISPLNKSFKKATKEN